MSDDGTKGLADRAQRVAGLSDEAVASENAAAPGEPVDLALLGAYQNLTPWHLEEGARLRLVRRLWLRVMEPFTDRQNRLNGYLAAAVSIQAAEIAALREQVARLEAAQVESSAGEDR